MKRYNPKEIEPRWQAKWEADAIYQVPDELSALSDKPKKYILEYFPYPSGAAMHVGHVRNYTIGDVLARFSRMQGYNVLHPMGWDGFGLPAENYAIKTGISPRQAIDDNTTKFKQQLTQMGFSYDWSREIDSTDPNYYRWTQWFFLMLFKLGLAYQKESLQWWCPHDKTVLANEQVEAGKCWRCGHDVEKKLLKQWFFKITEYADRLADDLDTVDWSDSIKAMQRNWIGKSKGAQIDFVVGGRSYECKDTLKFTPRLTEMIERGDKWSTIRLEPKKLAVGDVVKLQTRHSIDQVSSFAVARIKNIDTKKLGEIANNHPGHEFYKSDDEKLADYQGYYGSEISLKTDFTIYEFEKVANVVTVFTTRPDTLYGATFMVLSPEHGLVDQITTPGQATAVADYVKAAQAKSDIERQETNREKTGVFTGAYAINPINNAKIPIWIADYVLMGYGTGAIMAVPAHDERDNEFARKFELPIIRVVQNDAADDECSHAEGTMINSGLYDDKLSTEARENIVFDLSARGVGREVTNYKMRDWLISRQRYWGAPIPIVHCPTDGAVAVPEDRLPVVLPELSNIEPSGDGRSPLANVADFVQTTCLTCGGPAERETDTMDGFACSSWYFLRFADPHNDIRPFDADKAKFWLPVDDYIGGAEHAVMHLLYARFWTKVMHDQGLIEFDEPFTKLRNHGMILAPDGSKMSKSKGNTIEPSVLIDQGYGADSVRIMELFIGPWNQPAAWSVEGMGGAYRFLQRIWTLVQEYTEAKPTDSHDLLDVQRALHLTIKKVTENIATMSFNTAIAAMMELVNVLYKHRDSLLESSASREVLQTVTQLVAPFAPHIAEELWQQLDGEGSVHMTTWPKYDEALLTSDVMKIIIQVNGKLRGQIDLPVGTDEAAVKAAAQSDDKVAGYLEGLTIKKTIYVPGKLVNFVV